MNRLLRMIMNFAMREGINRGVDYVADRSAKKVDPNSPEGRAMRQQTRQTAKRSKQMLRMMRRLFRF